MILYKVPIERAWVKDTDVEEAIISVEIRSDRLTFTIQGHNTGFDVSSKVLDNIRRMALIENGPVCGS